MFNVVNTIICTEESSSDGSYRVKTSQLFCFAKRLAGFRMMLVFTRGYFREEYILIALSVKLLSVMIIVVFSKS